MGKACVYHEARKELGGESFLLLVLVGVFEIVSVYNSEWLKYAM